MPVHPTHPDPEELAAWQAGDLSGPGRARIEAHVSGCGDCAGLVAAVERGRAALAGLAEVEPPAGLHQRLAAAIEREAATPTPAAAGDGARERLGAARIDDRQGHRATAAVNGDGLGGTGSGTEPVPLDGRRRARRPPAGRRRIALLSTAAALILLVVGLVPLLHHGGGQTLATSGGGRAPETAPRALAGSAAGGALPVFSAPDGYSATALRSALASNPEARSAYQQAAGGSRNLSASGRPGAATPPLDSQGKSGVSAESPGGASGGGADATAAPAPSGLQQGSCVERARGRAGDQGLQPAFFVNTVYRGRAATVLVTVRPDAPDQPDLWAFPLGNCSSAPFAHDRVTVTPP